VRDELKTGCIDWFKPILEAIPQGWIAGGAVRDYFARVKGDSDIDVFFPSEEVFKSQSKALEDGALDGAKLVYDNSTATGFVWRKREIQLIKRHYFDSPLSTIKMFDFTVCCAAVDLRGVYFHEHFFEDLAGRRLAINALPFPLSTLQRLQRYVQKGFLACNGTLLELSKGIQGLDLDNPQENVLSFYPNGSPRFARYD
jgi:hypothetical protein